MPLLSPNDFAGVLEPLRGKRIGYIRPSGNVGDQLIELGTIQLFNAYGIRWKLISVEGRPDADELVFGGGGNTGSFYQSNWILRGRSLALGLPMTILPQSFLTREDRPYHRVYVRERSSLELSPRGILAPDMALGLECSNSTRPQSGTGIFIRRDCELAVKRPWGTRDPARLCKTPEQYLQLAAQYQRIITDRLHFAVCGLILGRDTTILPNSYHKNRSMYETWLRDLGCKFAANVSQALRQNKPKIFRFTPAWTLARPANKAA
jgi:exopolysaccharide biosynthesis predicted pyruvyltransferase EpsI